jgi:nicotinamidase-related amidase
LNEVNAQLESISTGIGQTPCLLVVDATLGFTDPQSPLGSEFSSEIEVIARLMQFANSKSWPCYLSSVVYRSESSAGVFRTKLPALNALTPGSRWVEIDPRLTVLASHSVFEKCYASAFFGTELGDNLRLSGIDTVIVTGFTTSGCVRASAVDALQWDFRVVVVKDAVGDRNQAAHEANLFDLGAKYSDVVSSTEIMQL